MEIELETLKEIAAEYFDIDDEEKFNDNWEDFMYCYEKIKKCKCVMARDKDSLINCMYFVAEDIASNDFFKSTTDSYGNTYCNFYKKYKPLDFIVSEALYRTYGDNSISSLSEEYISVKKLTLWNN